MMRRFALKNRAWSVWLRDPMLLPEPDSRSAAALSGANGVEIVGRRLLASNMSSGALIEATIDRHGARAGLRVSYLLTTGTPFEGLADPAVLLGVPLAEGATR